MMRKLLGISLAVILCFSLALCVSAEEYGVEDLLRDEAGLLGSAEEQALEAMLQEISHENQIQISIYTYSSMEDIEYAVTDTYLSCGLGYGENHDGVLLMISMDPRNYAMYTLGLADDAIYDSLAEDMQVELVECLQAEDYYGAFAGFAQSCGEAVKDYQTFDFGFNLILALVIGVVIGLIVALILKGQLKSVRMQKQANVYIKPGSMRLTVQSDLFLYRNVVRTKKPTNNSSGGRSGGGGGTVRSGSF